MKGKVVIMQRYLAKLILVFLWQATSTVSADDLDAWWTPADRTVLSLELVQGEEAAPSLCTLGQDCRQRFTASAYRKLRQAYPEDVPVSVNAAVMAIVRSVIERLPPQLTVEVAQRSSPISARGDSHLVYLARGADSAAPRSVAGSCLRQFALSLSDEPDPNALALSFDDPVLAERRLAEALLGFARTSGSMVSSAFPVVADGQPGAAALLLGMFDAGPDAHWAGNIKKLLIPQAGGLPESLAMPPVALVEDARGRPALESVDYGGGRLRATALTFWTDPARVLSGLVPPVQTGADGDAVRRGGAGQRVAAGVPPASAAAAAVGRDLFTEVAAQSHQVAGSQALLPLRADRASVALVRENLPRVDDDEALELLRWLLGEDVDEAPQRARPWLLGPVFHSRPLALDFGATGAGYTTSNPNIRIFFGSADGILHVVENTDAVGRESGREVYGFLPRILLPRQLERRTGEVRGSIHYGVDGSPVALRVDRNGDGRIRAQDGDEALVFFGLRRGGIGYYALDVTDVDRPPRLQWSLARTRGGDFDHLALSFSTPVVGRVQFGGTVRDVLLFGGGYHGGRDVASGEPLGKDAAAGDDPVGNAVYIVDARTGELVWKAVLGDTVEAGNTRFAHPDMRDSVASDLAVMVDAEGLIHRAYVGDTGGRIWRIDLPPGVAGNPDHRAQHWFVSVFAQLGAEEAGPQDRRFFHAPALVRTVDRGGLPVDSLLVTSGNRARPLATGVEDYAFYLRDRLIVSGDALARHRTPLEIGQLVPVTACEEEEGERCSAAHGAGWRLALASAGEKGWGRPLIDGGRALFSSFLPRSDPCEAPPGRGRAYAVNLADGTALGGQSPGWDAGPGMPAELLRVGNAILLPAEPPVIVGPDSGLVPGTVVQASRAPRLVRTYWREPGVDPL
jgi:type IV pilus assembly protein PilY1|tara:strand:+ start:44121 stop:46844 length:2724 start_codon:yes stop_codon:yes gene_type:complete